MGEGCQPACGLCDFNVANSLVRIWTDNIDGGYIADGRQGGRDFVRSMYPRWQQTPATAYELANEPDCNTNQGLANLREYTLGPSSRRHSWAFGCACSTSRRAIPHDNGTGDVGVSAWKWQRLRPAVVAAQQAGMWLRAALLHGVRASKPDGTLARLRRLAWDLEQLDVPGLRAGERVRHRRRHRRLSGKQERRVLTSEDAYRNDHRGRTLRTIPGIEALMVIGFGAQSPWESFDAPEGLARSLIAPLRALSAPATPPRSSPRRRYHAHRQHAQALVLR